MQLMQYSINKYNVKFLENYYAENSVRRDEGWLLGGGHLFVHVNLSRPRTIFLRHTPVN